MSVHPEGRLLAAVAGYEGLAFWNLSTGTLLSFIPLVVPPYSVLFEPSGTLLTAGAEGLYRWPVHASPARPTHLTIGPPERLLPLAMNLAQSQDGKVLAVVNRAIGRFEDHAGGWIIHRDKPEAPLRVDAGADLGMAALSPDGRWLVTVAHPTGPAKVWDTRDGWPVKILAERGMSRPEFSPDGRWLPTSLEGGRLYAVETWEPGPKVGGTGAFSPDTKMLAVESLGPLRLVDSATGLEYTTLSGPNQQPAARPLFSPNGAQLIARTLDKGIVVWDLRRLRGELAQLGLDWDLPPYAKPKPADGPRLPLTLTVNGGPYFTQAEHLLASAARHNREHNHGEALKALREAVRTAPDNARTHNNLAWLLLTGPEGLRDPAAALVLAQKAVELAPEKITYHNTLGVALYRNSKFADAIKPLEHSLKEDKGRTDAFDLFFVAMCHHRLGDHAKAKDCFGRAVEWVKQQDANLPAPWGEELRAFRVEAEALLARKQ